MTVIKLEKIQVGYFGHLRKRAQEWNLLNKLIKDNKNAELSLNEVKNVSGGVVWFLPVASYVAQGTLTALSAYGGYRLAQWAWN